MNLVLEMSLNIFKGVLVIQAPLNIFKGVLVTGRGLSMSTHGSKAL